MDAASYETPLWREERDRRLREWVGDEHAVDFLLAYGDACELFDDLIDRDKPVEDDHVVRVMFSLLTELPLNPFFDRYKLSLIPALVIGMNAWLDANRLESGDSNDQAFAYVLRDVYCEVVSLVVYLTRGRDYMREYSLEIRRFFTRHETLDQYRGGLG